MRTLNTITEEEGGSKQNEQKHIKNNNFLVFSHKQNKKIAINFRKSSTLGCQNGIE